MSDVKRGQDAQQPVNIPLLGWWDITKRIFTQMSRDNLSLVAAGVAFYALLAIFPALAALVSIYAYFASPTDIGAHLSQVIELLPESTGELILSQIASIAQSSSTSLSLSAIGTLILTIWSSSKGSQALITACNISYQEYEKRSFFKAQLVRFLFSIGAIVVAIFALLIIGILPVVLNLVGLKENIDLLITFISWPLLAFTFNFALVLLYRYAPHRKPAKWRWITLGSVIATILWIVASIGFSFYVSKFASYNETYGSLGGVVIMLMWLYISAYIVILGATINAASEQQTAIDSTIGPDKKRGERGAYVADHLDVKELNR
ncbi:MULTISPECIES: YihY/virulence factor BrkB family protein [Pseudoalteromonas]|jgi:membrane protein|uniref:Ribonuclease protein n=3 Tax=Gammaproteobacteria TaxID=1236 RepID=Q3IG15_PSET1|nr:MULTISPECIES: YihY/virulence factor BrkB family protein [Pseudoalteromonas]ASM55137.1 membrane protein [Pseudoalteromonas nigrifaciens]MBB1369299.1 YihY/virulence factor BrkB family protein [Pseudoalteromonas sp. SR45-4]MBE0419787.1 YihY/virulence factor BrkB family protein [Pseudoalteromonas nigrifaciens]MBH0070515.1 YihY/virulence factor BrkB family protein [Pseudoalteromonas sp. NZS127]MBO7925377.1 YihY/virulence factor BrkB family protein [Pseudoalteromonas sp. K222D]|tara:strand:- start:64681 stop:65640 length:960 start_codon:yes stop_codon:yes gene_type:complete